MAVVSFSLGYWQFNKSSKNSQKIITPTQQPNNATTQQFDKSKFSLTDANSIWVIVNKQHSIPTSFIPKLVVPDVKLRLSSSEEQMHINETTEPALKELFKAAQADNVVLVFGSGYRSANTQTVFYNNYKAKDGQEQADTYSARPGHSEHQTGFSADITSDDESCHLEICWADTQQGKWLADNAYKFGFVIRYPKDKQNITGYSYEPWHIRFVGKELALEIKKTGLTLEEFFNLKPAPNYD